MSFFGLINEVTYDIFVDSMPALGISSDVGSQMDQIASRSAISACLAVFGAVFDYWRMKLGKIRGFGRFVLV